MILLDDGWSAAASWDARIKAADELIANADNDRRGVALVPLSEPARDITLMPAGTARVALRQLAPKPYSIERVETLPSIERFLKATGDCEIAWLSDGIDTGRGTEFVEGLRKMIGERTLTIFEGGAPSAHALVAAENAAAKMTVKVLRTAAAASLPASVRARRRQGFADRRSALQLRLAGPRDRSVVRSAGGTAQRYRAAGNRQASGRPARCNCSTSDGAAAPSAWSAARAPIPRSRCWHRPSISPARWRRSPTSGSAITARRSR